MRLKLQNLTMGTAALSLGLGIALSHGSPGSALDRARHADADAGGASVASAFTNAPARLDVSAVRSAPATAATAAANVRAAKVQGALHALVNLVSKQSHPDALKYAFQAYYGFKAAHPEQVRKPYLYFVDYGLDSHTPRGYVFDMDALKVVDGPFTVAHGRGSGAKDGVPTKFSNVQDSNASSLGLFVAQETYAFTGHTGGRAYHSMGMRMNGVSGRFNDAARPRKVVVHGAPYVTPGKAGRSEGCPAMETARADKLIPKIGNGGMVFLFSPLDKQWLSGDPWAAGADAASAAAIGSLAE
ncbi:MAG: hypothetical protein JWM27_1892 [Gemmatimonadetes bacterium]|nr:hypothetical protein [Gemmatimonadota bacterium]